MEAAAELVEEHSLADPFGWLHRLEEKAAQCHLIPSCVSPQWQDKKLARAMYRFISNQICEELLRPVCIHVLGSSRPNNPPWVQLQTLASLLMLLIALSRIIPHVCY